MSDNLPPEPGESVRELVLKLIEGGMSPSDISEAMDKRVASRTIYRWAKGESAPQNRAAYETLVSLVASKCE